MRSMTYGDTPQTTAQSTSHPLRKIGLALLRILGGIIALILCIPVILLPFITSVPVLVWGALMIGGALLLILPFRYVPYPFAVTIPGLIVVSLLAVQLSQGYAATPPILNAFGVSCDSIASLEQVELGGTKQWISIRGENINNPVLLFLAGGPGGSELAWTRRSLAPLEEHFIVVNWDQPGCGKSYNAVPIASLTPERYLSDAYELVQILRKRFNQDKIYLMGESGGTIWGILLVQRYPELFHAWISGGGQMINTTENDIMGYEFALQYAAERGDTQTVEMLRRNGPPPYTGENMLLGKYYPYLNVLNDYMHEHAHGDGIPRNGLMDVINAPEYGLIDKVNWFRGLIDVFTQVYPQLADLDFRTQAVRLEVPVYFIEGRWDVNAMSSLVEEYYNLLDAPHKELIWFENSGHDPLYEESQHFADVMVNTVLAQTQPD